MITIKSQLGLIPLHLKDEILYSCSHDLKHCILPLSCSVQHLPGSQEVSPEIIYHFPYVGHFILLPSFQNYIQSCQDPLCAHKTFLLLNYFLRIDSQ